MKINKGFALVWVCCLMLSSSVLALNYKGDYKGEMVKSVKKYTQPKPKACRVSCGSGTFELNGTYGLVNLLPSNDLTIVPTPGEVDILQPTNSGDWDSWTGDLGLGYIYYFSGQAISRNAQLLPSIEPELNFYYSNNTVQGNVLRFGVLNDTSYKMPIISRRVMLDLTLTIASWQGLSFFTMGGIGESWNQVSYKDTTNATDDTRVSLTQETTKKLAWEVGAGFAYALDNVIRLSLEYLYTDFGKLNTPDTSSSTAFPAAQMQPSTFNLRSQAVLVGLHIAV